MTRKSPMSCMEANDAADHLGSSFHLTSTWPAGVGSAVAAVDCDGCEFADGGSAGADCGDGCCPYADDYYYGRVDC